MACFGALWGTVFEVKMPAKRPRNYFFAFIGTTCYNLTTQGTLRTYQYTTLNKYATVYRSASQQ